jgi:hypothetical protein
MIRRIYIMKKVLSLSLAPVMAAELGQSGGSLDNNLRKMIH